MVKIKGEVKMITESFYIRSPNQISFSFNGNLIIIDKSHMNYNKILDELSKENLDWDMLEKLVNVRQELINYFDNHLWIKDNKFYYKWRGKMLELTEDNPLILKILRYWNEGRKVNYLVAFLSNLVRNPLKTAINELPLFLDANDIELTEDGCFLAYKRVNDDFTDCYSGTFDNSPGKIVSVPRSKVEFNRTVTCAQGLHFCSKSYLPHYAQGCKVVCVKVNPKDVVSIPEDYSNAKGRCCKYEVIKEITEDFDLKDLLEDSVSYMKELPTFSTVQEARKNCVRKIGWSCIVQGRGTKYLPIVYSFKDGTTNKHLTRD